MAALRNSVSVSLAAFFLNFTHVQSGPEFASERRMRAPNSETKREMSVFPVHGEENSVDYVLFSESQVS